VLGVELLVVWLGAAPDGVLAPPGVVGAPSLLLTEDGDEPPPVGAEPPDGAGPPAKPVGATVGAGAGARSGVLPPGAVWVWRGGAGGAATAEDVVVSVCGRVVVGVSGEPPVEGEGEGEGPTSGVPPCGAPLEPGVADGVGPRSGGPPAGPRSGGLPLGPPGVTCGASTVMPSFAPPMPPETAPDVAPSSTSFALMSCPMATEVPTELTAPSTAPRVAPTATWPARPPPWNLTPPDRPPTRPETAPLTAAWPVLLQSQSLRSPVSIWMPWMAASMPTEIATSLRIAMISCRNVNWTINRVACWAIGMPADAPPKVANAAAISAAISMASAISDAMIDSFVYSTSSAVPSQLSASCSQIFLSFGR